MPNALTTKNTKGVKTPGIIEMTAESLCFCLITYSASPTTVKRSFICFGFSISSNTAIA